MRSNDPGRIPPSCRGDGRGRELEPVEQVRGHKVMAAYIGHLSTTAGDGPEVVIKLAGLDVVVVTPDERRHVWPAHLVKITGVASPRFRIEFDDEMAVFTAHHPSRFLFEFVPALQRVRAAVSRTADRPADPPSTEPTADSTIEVVPASEAPARAETAAEPDPRPEPAPPVEIPATPEPQPEAPPPVEISAAGPAFANGDHPAAGESSDLGDHWASPDEDTRSRLLRATTFTRLPPADVPTEPPDPQEPDRPTEPTERQPLTAYRPRRRLFRRAPTCAHRWELRTIGGYRGMICVECFEVSLTRDLADAPDETAEHIVVDLTDDGLAAGRSEDAGLAGDVGAGSNDGGVEAMPDDEQTGRLLERLAGRYRDARRVGNQPPRS